MTDSPETNGASTPPVARRRAAETVNTITVTVRPVWGEQRTMAVPQDSTVEALLSQCGYPATTEVRLISQGETSILTTDSVLEDGDVLQVVSQKKVVNG